MIRELIRRLRRLVPVKDEVVLMDDEEFEALFLYEEEDGEDTGGEDAEKEEG